MIDAAGGSFAQTNVSLNPYLPTALPSPFQDTVTLNYNLQFVARSKVYCINTFLRISPEYKLESTRTGALPLQPVPYVSEIFSEWRWYNSLLVSPLLIWAREGAAQYYASQICPPTRQTQIASSFVNTLAEPRRTAHILKYSLSIGLLTNLLATWFLQLSFTAHPSSTEVENPRKLFAFIAPESWWNNLNKSLVILTLVLIVGMGFNVYLHYHRIFNNPPLLADFREYIRIHSTLLWRLLGFEPNQQGARQRMRLSRIAFSVIGGFLSLWIWSLVVFLGGGQEVEHLVITFVAVFGCLWLGRLRRRLF